MEQMWVLKALILSINSGSLMCILHDAACCDSKAVMCIADFLSKGAEFFGHVMNKYVWDYVISPVMDETIW